MEQEQLEKLIKTVVKKVLKERNQNVNVNSTPKAMPLKDRAEALKRLSADEFHKAIMKKYKSE